MGRYKRYKRTLEDKAFRIARKIECALYSEHIHIYDKHLIYKSLMKASRPTTAVSLLRMGAAFGVGAWVVENKNELGL